MRLDREFSASYFRIHPQLEHYLQFLIPEEKEMPLLTLSQAIEYGYLDTSEAKQLGNQETNTLELIREYLKAMNCATALSKVASQIITAHSEAFPSLNPQVRNQNDKLIAQYNARADDFYAQIRPTTTHSYR